MDAIAIVTTYDPCGPMSWLACDGLILITIAPLRDDRSESLVRKMAEACQSPARLRAGQLISIPWQGTFRLDRFRIAAMVEPESDRRAAGRFALHPQLFSTVPLARQLAVRVCL